MGEESEGGKRGGKRGREESGRERERGEDGGEGYLPSGSIWLTRSVTMLLSASTDPSEMSGKYHKMMNFISEVIFN